MTELEMLAKFTVENNGKWALLEEKDDIKLFESTKPFECNHYYYNETPVYQIFRNGKRVLATTNYSEAYQCYLNYLMED